MPELDFSKIKTFSIKKRKNKLKIRDFIKPQALSEIENFLTALPDVFKAKELKNLVDSLIQARNKNSPIIWMIGDAVIKSGLTPLLTELGKHGFITWLAGQGAVAIHDIEIAIAGETSEDVGESLFTGRFGFAEETGSFFSSALKEGKERKMGIGEILPVMIEEEKLPFKEYSLIYNFHKLNIPTTFHIAFGTDITHIHPLFDAESAGWTTYRDFQRFAGAVADMGNGGVVLNIASAVIMPEVFLKALSVAINLGFSPSNFTTCNIDQIQHYRPLQNVVLRPTREKGKGFSITANIEIFLPLLGAILLKKK